MDPQDQTFMTIHNLTPDANILFASESILDILGYSPEEVINKSCFDYFHPDEVPLARSVHSRGVRLDKAAVLHYARILSKDGRWVSCECCFTIVHDVLVASTSIYNGGAKSEGRALTAPRVRRLFSSSPRDPRYHMLEHLSPKFKMPPTEREPRAALVLNRFTRNLTIMFATNAVTTILGLRPDELLERPFYHCIQENCLADAIACLESAKKNESIAYLRFRFRDPRQDDRGAVIEQDEQDDDEDETDSDIDSTESDGTSQRSTSPVVGKTWDAENDMEVDEQPFDGSRSRQSRSAGNHRGVPCQDHLSTQPTETASRQRNQEDASFELEAVVSCTSDGLIVVLRRARPPIPDPQLPLVPAFNYENGLFAAPWGMQPIEPDYPPELLYTFRAPFLPQYMPLQEHVKRAGGPPRDQLMRSIRDVAVFAWAVVGINGSLATYGHGLPGIGAQPHDSPAAYRGPENPLSLQNFRPGDAPRPNPSCRACYRLDHNPLERHIPLSLRDNGAHGAYQHPEDPCPHRCSLSYDNRQPYHHVECPGRTVEQNRPGYSLPRDRGISCGAPRPYIEPSGRAHRQGCADTPTFQSPTPEDSHYHIQYGRK